VRARTPLVVACIRLGRVRPHSSLDYLTPKDFARAAIQLFQGSIFSPPQKISRGGEGAGCPHLLSVGPDGPADCPRGPEPSSFYRIIRGQLLSLGLPAPRRSGLPAVRARSEGRLHRNQTCVCRSICGSRPCQIERRTFEPRRLIESDPTSIRVRRNTPRFPKPLARARRRSARASYVSRQFAHTRGRRDQVDSVGTCVPSVCGTADRNGGSRCQNSPIRNSSFCPRLRSAMIAELNCPRTSKAKPPERLRVVLEDVAELPLAPVYGEFVNHAAIGIWNRLRQSSTSSV
jgi:hypothetical protein